MKITLIINGEPQEFVQSFIPGRVFRRAIQAQKLLKEKPDLDTIDFLAETMVEFYGKQFTVDQFYDGIDARVLIGTFLKHVDIIVNGAAEAVGADASDPN